MDITNETRLIDAAGIVYLTHENCIFEKNGDFLSMKRTSGEDTYFSRVNLHRMFPYDKPYEFISVLNTDSEEVGLIIDIGSFSNEVGELLKNELDRKYYVCPLKSIVSIKDRFGFAYWKTIGVEGNEITFTIKDIHSSIRQNAGGMIMISDIDGNKYTLPSSDELDSKSRKLVELYL